MEEPDLLRASLRQQFDTDVEFSIFQEKAPLRIREECERLPRFRALKRLFNNSFCVQALDDDVVQGTFGTRPMFRKDLDGKAAVEGGLALHYARGPTGEVAVSIYPCASTLARTHESQIHLRIGHFSAAALLASIPRDVADLVAYGQVSSLAGRANFRERLRIRWLRIARPTQKDGGFVEAKRKKFVRACRDEAGKAVYIFVLGLGVVVAVWVLDRLGLTSIADLVRTKSP